MRMGNNVRRYLLLKKSMFNGFCGAASAVASGSFQVWFSAVFKFRVQSLAFTFSRSLSLKWVLITFLFMQCEEMFILIFFQQSAAVQLIFIYQLLFCSPWPSFYSHQNLQKFSQRQSRFLLLNSFLNMQMGVRLIFIFCCLIMRMKCISVKRWYGCLGGSSVSPPLTSISNQYLQFAR